MSNLEKVRVDKWLWAVRIFKSRTIATEAIKAGKVKMGDNVLKPSHNLKVNDSFQLRKDGFVFTFRVLGIIAKRVGAPIAVTCYADLTPDEEKMKYQNWYATEQRDRGTGRPTKRDRRDMDEFKTTSQPIQFYFDDATDDDDEDED